MKKTRSTVLIVFFYYYSFKKPFSKKNGTNEEDDDDDDDDNEESNRKANYRDRAAERRKQGGDHFDDSQLSTEELLKRTQAEVGDELDAKQLYEQSKYLGGDVQHTHLVKGLDFALLRKVRTDLENKQKQHGEEMDVEEEQQDDKEEEREEEDLDQVLEKFERGEKIQDDETMEEKEEEEDKPKFQTVMTKNIYDQILQQSATEQPRVELFEPGRMAFVFELADEVGHYSDAFAIPTALIRSKADTAAKLSRSGGWSEETQAETNLVIEKISQVMEAVRRGDRHHGTTTASSLQQQQKKNATKELTSQPIAVVEDMFMGDIFADAGRDYELDETKAEKSEQARTMDKKKNYFDGLVEEEDEEMPDASNNEAVDALLSQATGGGSGLKPEQDTTKEQVGETNKKRKHNQVEMDADAADIDMFGLSSSALPTSFEEHHTAYQSDDDDNEKAGATQLIDQGTNKNKKAQLTRWDFDTEEEWQNYKNSVEITPKSAFQFGVKLSDGRKRNRERKGLNDKQRLDRDYQQVKNIMSKKYGKSLDK